MARCATASSVPGTPSLSPTFRIRGRLCCEQVSRAVVVALGPSDLAKGERDERHEARKAELLVQRQALLQQTPRRRMVLPNIRSDHAEVVQNLSLIHI